ncbi:hypothetical protein [Paenibacillus alvei]|uniref:hypothetical protein n=1 Tax=Paenibacillus alvei TaxID=44250 RepID=UPI002282C9E9|nr:hypothetical protein [Paenibacillus alvei]
MLKLVENICNVDEEYFQYNKEWWELAYYNGEKQTLKLAAVSKRGQYRIQEMHCNIQGCDHHVCI